MLTRSGSGTPGQAEGGAGATRAVNPGGVGGSRDGRGAPGSEAGGSGLRGEPEAHAQESKRVYEECGEKTRRRTRMAPHCKNPGRRLWAFRPRIYFTEVDKKWATKVDCRNLGWKMHSNLAGAFC